MSSAKKFARIGHECVACGVCAKTCPLRIITIHKGINAVVDGRKCVGCGKCAKACPAGVITIMEVKRHEEALV
ncbi:MAG: 4Fe-4S binding protein [Clostridia bacterium]|nr:4Fe-4S binding protein [Clostridia bacterium]